MSVAPLVSAQSLYAAPVAYPVLAPRRLVFPHDHGAHPEHRIEWWYVTGWLAAPGVSPFGFQVTFFQLRPGTDESNPSRFALRHVVVAHAALAWPPAGRLLHAARSARSGLGLVGAQVGDCGLMLDRWRMNRTGEGFRIELDAGEFALALRLDTKGPPLLHGLGGFSQKAPGIEHASMYYSLPQVTVSGSVRVAGRAFPGRGAAWFDHEWSSTLMHPQAAGWDWTGLNLHDGSALMLFRMRDRGGNALWSGGSLRTPDGDAARFNPGEVRWQPSRNWRSPRTGVQWPVMQAVRFGQRVIQLEPLFDDQELDARATTGTLYWEGAVRALEAGREIGRGYLELTGYDGPLVL
ncbi:lipocalin-like domain-containing protein [Niveibacterium umoris]|uniref:Putative secreted hydrolase n=1 Tax=Niveibacterium umoris TaxID=1193620 RepID=A0A840BEA3_9RHOO|nr:carotenoid 1,2-hydratase [Niveibacterium umoris]MBB4011435.1 putative secreted hydrolase [Niveibacterium umoris]